jgi:hypothetical protein
MVSTDHFRQELLSQLGRAAGIGRIDLLINSGELCRSLPAGRAWSASCCDAMEAENEAWRRRTYRARKRGPNDCPLPVTPLYSMCKMTPKSFRCPRQQRVNVSCGRVACDTFGQPCFLNIHPLFSLTS